MVFETEIKAGWMGWFKSKRISAMVKKDWKEGEWKKNFGSWSKQKSGNGSE